MLPSYNVALYFRADQVHKVHQARAEREVHQVYQVQEEKMVHQVQGVQE